MGVGVGRDSRYGSIYLSTPLSTARFVSRHPHSEGRPRRESVRFLRLYELLAWRCAGAGFAECLFAEFAASPASSFERVL